MRLSQFPVPAALLAGLLSLCAPCHAELLPEGVFGAMLGQPRALALTEMVEAGVQMVVDTLECSENVPARDKEVADRICKMAVAPGSAYETLPVRKVSFLLKDDIVVLIGLEMGTSSDAFSTLSSRIAGRLGPPGTSVAKSRAMWKEFQRADGTDTGTKLSLWADKESALLVYTYQAVP